MNNIALLIFVIVLLNSCKTTNNEHDKDLAFEKKTIEVNPGIFISRLPDKLLEGSGLIFYDNLFWSLNDSGGDNIVFGFNREGKIQKEIEITNADNIDWEDITQDDTYIYIGDFGNNAGIREDLKVYKIRKSDLTAERRIQVNAEEIQFSYKNQTLFRFRPFGTEFDGEALAEFDNKLYLFTKNWINETTAVYELPKSLGEYNLEPIDSFNVAGLITGADFSPDKSKLALVGYHNFKPILRLFSKFSGDRFFSGERVFIEMDSITGAQTEGICFLGNDTLLISCERTGDFNQQVFYVDLKTID